MTKKDDEEKKTWVALVGKIAVAVLGAMAAGGAGSVALGPAGGSAEQEERISKLESACSGYSVRLATTETKLQNYESNLVEVRKDLAEIRSTNTQILFILQKER